jgi:hypothetical protein
MALSIAVRESMATVGSGFDQLRLCARSLPLAGRAHSAPRESLGSFVRRARVTLSARWDALGSDRAQYDVKVLANT